MGERRDPELIAALVWMSAWGIIETSVERTFRMKKTQKPASSCLRHFRQLFFSFSQAAMAAALLSSVFYRNPNPNPNLHGNKVAATVSWPSISPSFSSTFQSEARRGLGLPVLAGSPSSTRSSIRVRSLGSRLLAVERRLPKLVAFAAPHEDSKHSEIGVERAEDLGVKKDESKEAWKEMLESFKEEAIKLQAVSQEAYEIYSKRAIIILKETSENLKIQADQARSDVSRVAKEISEEGKQFLSTASENSPESLKDIIETFASSPNEFKDVSEIHDFHFGIPYGAFLAIRGFLHFMLTGSISAIRFGVILGSALLALSVSSLRAWKRGQPSALFLKGQTVIATVIFVREWRLASQRLSFATSFMTLISGAMLLFYVFMIIIVDNQSKGPSSEQGSDD